MAKHIYFFGGGQAEGRAEMKELLGGKGANLAEMDLLKIPVPPGFTITTEVCTHYQREQGYPAGLEKELLEQMSRIEKLMDAKFGSEENPLLVSVRSGARASMPGMMDTVLNLGLNDKTVEALAKRSGNPRFAYDSYRRFIAMYGDVVMDLKPSSKDEEDPFEVLIARRKRERNIRTDVEMTVEDLQGLVEDFKAVIREHKGTIFPENPLEQLWGAIGAVFNSWQNPRAEAYRRLNRIPDDWGTAVNVQAMVFGNLGNTCATGVAFTRDPATGEKIFYGEFLIDAQGEDVVAGTRTPQQVTKSGSQQWAKSHDINEKERKEKYQSLEEFMPDSYRQLIDISDRLEERYRDMNDIEFTVQDGKLWMLQCRIGKRTGQAAIRMAVEMEAEGLIKKEEALLRVEPDALNQLLRPVFDIGARGKVKPLARGLNAGPGAASGRIVFNAPDAEAWAEKGERVILVRIETSPEDIRGMNASEGILTERGGMTSHAALVARQMGKVCVAGCGALEIDYAKRRMRVSGTELAEGDWLSLDGTTGEVFAGQIATRPSEILQVLFDKTLKPEDAPVYQQFAKLLNWADDARRLQVRTNADQPDQCEKAVAFGAEGIGLCRTEHMFFEGDRIDAVREMIMAETLDGRRKALAKLLPYQREDFVGIFRVMAGKPVTIRTLDPPLHEFLPHDSKTQSALAKKLGKTPEEVRVRVESLSEANPMLGHRGCRLGLVYPEITEMQTRAIFEAALQVEKEGIPVHPEIMIPLVGHVRELENQAKVVRRVAEDVMKEKGKKIDFLVGTMIELPRAALIADEIAGVAEFFSFGTNDLTQTTLGLSRDDSGNFMLFYLAEKIIPHDPFQSIDIAGVGQLVRMGVERGRQTNSKLKIGICGEHGGDPYSVNFFHQAGLNYVSCSPFRIPIARLAAAQAALRER
ncbi:pyruvate, phosphate dikinase [bacterium]|nr:pyruvate, phosphate dikinase [bacterium]